MSKHLTLDTYNYNINSKFEYNLPLHSRIFIILTVGTKFMKTKVKL